MQLNALKRELTKDLDPIDVRIILQHCTGWTHEQLLLNSQTELPDYTVSSIKTAAAKRKAQKPTAKIIGKKEFFGRDFFVNEAVLDPRPDSETLITDVLELSKQGQNIESILDLGTGSGCLAVTLLKELPEVTATAVDVSTGALSVVRRNMRRHKVSNRLKVQQGSWCEPLDGELFDLIISNPPYIESDTIRELDAAVREYDPSLALDGGEDGLEPYRILAKQARTALKLNGYFVCEIGVGQEEQITQIFNASDSWSLEKMVTDLSGRVRVLRFRAL